MPDDKDNPQGYQADLNRPSAPPSASRWKRRWNTAKPGVRGEQPPGSQAEAPAPAPLAAPAAIPGKKSHWVRRSLLTILALLIVLVALAPTLISTGTGRGMIVSAVNDRIVGKVAMGDLSLSWFSGCHVGGLGVTDPQGRKVVNDAQVNWDRSLWNLLWSRENLGKLDVHSRSVDIIQTADGSISLQKAFEMRQPSPADQKPSDGTFSPTVDLNWDVDQVRVVQLDGRDYTISDTKGQVQTRTLNDILVDLSTTLLAEDRQPKGSRLTVHAALRDLFAGAGGNFDYKTASGTISVKTDPPIAVKPILAFATQGVEGKGDLNLDLTGKLSPGQSELKYSIAVKNLSAASAGEKAPVPPMTADLSGAADYKADKLHGTLKIGGSTSNGPLGEILSELTYDTSGKTQIKTDHIAEALLKGQSVELPEFTLDAGGGLNLAEAIKSIPGLIPLRKGAQITGGDLKIDRVHIQGGAAPSAQGGMTLHLATVRAPGKAPRTWEPITIAFKFLTDADKQLKIEKADVELAPIASLHGSGTAAKSHLEFKSDLDALRARLDEVIDLDKITLAGNVSGSLDTVRPENDKQIGLTLNAKAQALSFANESIHGNGDFNLDVKGKFSPEQSEATYTIGVKNLSVANADQKSTVPPLNADLSGAADYVKDKKLHGTLKVGGTTSSGTLGEIQSELAYNLSDKTEIKTDQITDALMKGQSVTLPDFTLDASGGLNLAEAIKSIPGLIPLRNGAKITGGDLKIERMHIQGGAAPAGEGGLTLLLTTVREGQSPRTWEPINVGFKFLTGSDKQLKIEKADVAIPPFVSLHGSGSPAKSHLAFESDLAALRDRLDEVVDLDKITLGGKVSGNLDTARAEGEDKQIDLTLTTKAEAFAFASESIQAKGDLNLDLTGKLSRQQSEVKYTIGVKNFSVANPDQKSNVSPLNADFAGAADYKAKKLHGTLKIGGSTSGGALGEIQSELTYDTASQPEVKTDQIVDALMKGQSVVLPDFALDVSGGLNLAEVIKSVPGLIPLRKGAQITSGDLKVERIHIQGGNAPAAEGGLTLHLTTVRSQGQPPKVWEPITVAFKFLTDADKQMKIDKADITFPPLASLNGSGSPRQSHWAFESDLAGLRDRLNEVLNLDTTSLGGKVSGSLDTARAQGDDKQIGLTLNAKAQDVVFAGARESAAAAAAKPAPPTAYTGEVQWKASVERLSDGLKLLGKLQVPELKLSDFGEVFPGDKLVLDYELTAYTNKAGGYDRLEVKSFSLDSKLLKANLAGSIDKLGTDNLLDIKGDHILSLPEATALAKRLSPEGAKTLKMLGDKKYAIVIKGPASNPEVTTTAFPPVEGNTAAGWANGSEVYGLTMGDAELTPSLGNARITLPVAKVPANGGTLGLGGMVDLSKKDNPRLVIKDRLDVMDHVGLNAQVGHDILSMALPLLANMSELDGTVSLWVEGVDLPLSGEKIKREGTGRGHLDFSSVRLRPTGPMAQLLKLTGMSSDALFDQVKFSPVDFELNNGALSYDNFTMTIGSQDPFDLKFHGTVRFDGSVDLFVSVPVKASFLSEFGVKDPTGQIAKVLDGERIDIPISGSRTNSKLDMSKVNIKPMVDRAIKKIGTGALMSNLPGLPGENPKTPTSGPAPTSKPAGPLKVPVKIPGLFK